MSACIYVLLFDQGTVKVGISAEPEARILSHASAAARFNVQIVSQWVSGPHQWAPASERALIDWCTQSAESVVGKEWFRGLSFDAVRDFASGLDTSPQSFPRLDAFSGMLLSIPDAAGLLELESDQPIRDLIASGEIPYVELSPCARRVAASDLRALVASGKRVA